LTILKNILYFKKIKSLKVMSQNLYVEVELDPNNPQDDWEHGDNVTF
jgi:hypothetical protein